MKLIQACCLDHWLHHFRIIGRFVFGQLAQPLLPPTSNVALKVDSVLFNALAWLFAYIRVKFAHIIGRVGFYLLRHKIRAFANRFSLNNSIGPRIYNQSILVY